MSDLQHPATLSRGPSYLDWSTKGRPGLWRYLFAAIAGYLALPISGLLLLPLESVLAEPGYETVAQLFAFLGLLVAVLLLTRVVLRRPGYTAGLPAWPPWMRDWFTGIAMAMGVVAAVRLILLPVTPVKWVGWDASAGGGIVVMLLILFGLIVQTGAEELYFRGLLTQAVFRASRRLSAGWAVGASVVVPSVWFAVLHVGNIEEFGGGWQAALPYFVMAALFAWAAIRSGSVMLAAGLHMGNNTFLVFVVSNPDDVLGGFAPLEMAEGTDLGTAILAALLGAAIGVLAIEVAARKHLVGGRRAGQV